MSSSTLLDASYAPSDTECYNRCVAKTGKLHYTDLLSATIDLLLKQVNFLMQIPSAIIDVSLKQVNFMILSATIDVLLKQVNFLMQIPSAIIKLLKQVNS